MNELLYFFKRGSARSQSVKRNITYAFFIRTANIFFSFLIVRLSLSLVGDDLFGLWLAIFSFIEMFNFLDIGLGNGLRNKLVEAIANKDYLKANKLISSTYIFVAFIVVIMLLIVLPLSYSLDFKKLFNIQSFNNIYISNVMIYLFFFFGIIFILKTVNSIYNALQKPYITGINLLITNSLKTIFLIVLGRFFQDKFLGLIIINTVSPIFSLLFFNVLFFLKNREFVVSFDYFDKFLLKENMKLGIKFFISQLSVLILFSTDNLIIAKLFNSSQVVPYNIARKFFNIEITLFSILMMPIWSAVTDAYVKNDHLWIKQSNRKLVKIWSFLIGITFVMIFFSKQFYQLWIGKSTNVSYALSALMGFYVLIQSWNDIYGSFLNGIGKVKLQMYILIFGALINIPLSIFFGKYCGFGINGVILATIVCISFFAIIGPLQYHLIINNKARGIWNK